MTPAELLHAVEGDRDLKEGVGKHNIKELYVITAS